MDDVFLDTSYAIALSTPSDLYQRRAVELAGRIKADGARLVTTRAVLIEIGNAMSKARYRKAAVTLLNAIENDPRIDILPLSDPLYGQALDLYRRRQDKEWGLTDCISFVVMQERGLPDALTADKHFQQAGFRAMLLETDIS